MAGLDFLCALWHSLNLQIQPPWVRSPRGTSESWSVSCLNGRCSALEEGMCSHNWSQENPCPDRPSIRIENLKLNKNTKIYTKLLVIFLEKAFRLSVMNKPPIFTQPVTECITSLPTFNMIDGTVILYKICKILMFLTYGRINFRLKSWH